MLLLSLLMFSSACATNGPAISECSWVKPIYISKSDTLTDGTASQILGHNQKWKAICDKK